MQPLRTVFISTAEWRWVIVISGILVSLTLLPYAWALARNETDEEWQFMGVLYNPKDGATYLSKIEQGRAGSWLFELRHTPEEHDGAGFHTFYLFLGHAARIFGLSSVFVYHIARVATSLFMYMSLYQLGATIWVRQRPRRVFFILLAMGSGLGWLWLLAGTSEIAVDMTIPEAFPLLASYTNPHFPMSIAALALIVSVFIIVFRRGYTAEPSVENGGLGVMLLSMLLALIQPTALLPIGGALVLYIIARYYITQDFPFHELRWSSMLLLPALPFAVYDMAVFRYNDIMGEFNRQNQTLSPAIYLYVIGYGMLLIVAIPGLVRAIRRFERDGDQLMLLWIIVNVVGLYAPFNLQRRLSLGLIIPLVYFATRSLEDYWYYKIPQKRRALAMMVLIVLILPSNVLNLGLPLYGVVFFPERGRDSGLVIESDYWDAFQWLQDNGEQDAVVLASSNISLWIPAYTDQVVVYGHEYETVPAKLREAQVDAWYHGEDCVTLLGDTVPFKVRYIFWGPQEREMREDDDGEVVYPQGSKCINTLPPERIEQELTFGDVTLYVME